LVTEGLCFENRRLGNKGLKPLVPIKEMIKKIKKLTFV